ncbi:DUF445 domain-containing protein [Clostridiaceae bacterium UIB06]|uniref:DUF445 domain-containing protein n=1 Tax=Clostridium thailandense TaxID=2794346 RepID=A0A949TF74_9CLOT|nr:DUF445 domain-containing protein [Clostridium thailandense]MBV7271674.1 DUF445 domain-containing protein [Clostridium thailandense]MCH5136355.1 DUF445 domain-containing protein [Clostridiaceae bacterium UIB06]
MENKKIADRLLFILLIAFIAVICIKVYFHKSFLTEMLGFVIEAALVGGIADWFAITALYEKPLGFPWHTAIIPRNRDKVINSIAYMVENELLNEKTLQGKIKEIKIIDILIEYIDKSVKQGGYIFEFIEKYSIKFLDDIDVDKIAKYIEGDLKNNLKEIDLTTYLSKILMFTVKSSDCEKLFINVLDEIITKAKQENTRSEIHNMINEIIKENIDSKKGIQRMLMQVAVTLAEETNSVNTLDAAYSIQEQILEVLLKLKDINDPIHIEMINKIEQVIEKLHTDEEVIFNVEKWKLDTIEKITITNELNSVIENTIIALKYSIKKGNVQVDESLYKNGDVENFRLYLKSIEPVIYWLKKQVHGYWENFKNDSKAKRTMEVYIKGFLYKIIKSEHHLIGIVVSKTLSNLTDDSLNDFIQEKAGNDLHWIRINGCIIGALFGLFVFLFMNEIYLPIVSKFIHLI